MENKKHETEGKKMKQHKILIVTLITALIFSMGSPAFAGKFGNRPHGGMGHGFGGLRMLMDLDLSDLQKKQVYDIIEKYRGEKETAAQKAREARKQIKSVIHAESFNENDFRQAFQKRALVMEDLATVYS